MNMFFLRVVLLVISLLAVDSFTSIVSNTLPRVDAATGEILDIHDGSTIRIGDTFYWYGASYGSCVEMSSGCASVKLGACGFNANHTVSLATSTDLVNWNLVGVVLDVSARPEGILFGPWVAQSATTGLFVMWTNILPVVNGGGDFDASRYVVATSIKPEGPFVTVVANVTGLAYNKLPDSPSIFVDDNGSGYIAFTHEDSHTNNVQELTSDLLGPKIGGMVSPTIGANNNEGVLMFKRSGIYYVGFGQCCCFCSAGSNVQLWMSNTPTGTYTLAGNLMTSNVWGAQTGGVWFTGIDYVLFGDRWQSSPDKLKSHDFSYMTPFAFNADGTVNEIATTFQKNVSISY